MLEVDCLGDRPRRLEGLELRRQRRRREGCSEPNQLPLDSEQLLPHVRRYLLTFHPIRVWLNGLIANNGTASPAYSVTNEREGANGALSNYQSITAMPAYKAFSFEELRVQDYAAGRKTAAGTGFGATTGFGGAAATPATTVGAFGQPAPTTGAFGQPAATGAFGQTTTTTGAFGQPQQQQQPATTGFGGFGQTNTNTTGGGLFGQTQQQQPATGAFGQPATTNAFGGTTFGQPQQQQQQPATGLFGNTATTGAFGAAAAPKPAFGGFGESYGSPILEFSWLTFVFQVPRRLNLLLLASVASVHRQTQLPPRHSANHSSPRNRQPQALEASEPPTLGPRPTSSVQPITPPNPRLEASSDSLLNRLKIINLPLVVSELVEVSSVRTTNSNNNNSNSSLQVVVSDLLSYPTKPHLTVS